jgi:hypothetical protein
MYKLYFECLQGHESVVSGKGLLQGSSHNVSIDNSNPPKHILPPFSACASNIVVAPELVEMVNPTRFVVLIQVQLWSRYELILPVF